MVIVARAVIRLAATGSRLEFVGECGCPLLPGKMPLLGEVDGKRECAGLPVFGKYGLARDARQARQRREEIGFWCKIWFAQGVPPIDIIPRVRALLHNLSGAPEPKFRISRSDTVNKRRDGLLRPVAISIER